MSYTVAVRALAEFSAKSGDLDLRFTPTPSAQEGIAGHALVAARRNSDYESELALSGEYLDLRVRGRADGYDPVRNQLEEVKTFRGDLQRMPDNQRQLHWAQLRIYGWLLCQERGLPELRLALVYFDIDRQRETVLREDHTAVALQDFFIRQCQRFLHWARRETTHRRQRDTWLAALRFPHPAFRTGQRELAEAAYKAVSTGRCLMAEAPTGIGKTMGSLFPMLKAMPIQALDKLYFLTAKTPGRQLALDALTRLGQSPAPPSEADPDPDPPLRVLELIARDKACEYPDRACHGDACPLARGFYDRLPAARSAAVGAGTLDRVSLRDIALAHEVCPYYLSQELIRWCDVVIGDYNYYFDFSAALYSLATVNGWRIAVLIDEAHNLVDRGRAMYTAELDQHAFREMRRAAPEALKQPLQRIQRQWGALNRSLDRDAASGTQDNVSKFADYHVSDQLPTSLLSSLQHTLAIIEQYLVEHPIPAGSALQTFCFEAMHFLRLAEQFDPHFLFDIQLQAGAGRNRNSRLCIRNIIPAAMMAQRFRLARSTLLFSATLSPPHFYRDLLGLPPDTAWVRMESPFADGQLAVRVVDAVSTRFQHRSASLSPITALMAEHFALQPGNYLAFFSSFEYLDQVAKLFRERYPNIPIWQQSRRMDEGERRDFLDRFSADGQGIGFAVLGGAFGEGIDLPGSRLRGAFIATLGLPQINPVNQTIRRRMQLLFGSGFEYTYLYPGLRKVIQAAGRVIRTERDRGTVVLIDQRYADPEIRRLLPDWWKIPAPSYTAAPAVD